MNLMFAALALAQPSMADFLPGGASMWMYRSAADAMTDKIVSSARIDSEDGSASLTIKCDAAVDQVISIQYRTRKYLGSGERLVTLRFDKQPAINLHWETNDKFVYERDPSQVTRIVQAMASSERLMIRAFDFENRTIDAAFSILGSQSSNVWRKVFADCMYPDPIAGGSPKN